MVRRFDLSGGSRGGLDGSQLATPQKPQPRRSGSGTFSLVVFVIALAMIAGIALAIFADGYPRFGEPKPDGIVQTREKGMGVVP